jgi:hypothetical protein
MSLGVESVRSRAFASLDILGYGKLIGTCAGYDNSRPIAAAIKD